MIHLLHPLAGARTASAVSRRPARSLSGPILAAAGLALVLLVWPAAAQQPPATSASAGLAPGLSPGAHDAVINGVRLWYRVAGHASAHHPPVVFLHGGPGQGSQSFAALAGPHLEGALQMVYFDQRGSGRSERPWTGAYALETLVEDIEGLRRQLGVEQVALIGHSFGTVLALEYAAAHPERVSRMVLTAAVPDLPAAVCAMCARLAEVHPAAYARATSAEDTSGVDCDVFGALPDAEREAFFLANMFPDTSLAAKLDSVDAAQGLRNTGELSRALFEAGLPNYRFSAHDRLTMPVLILAGRLDYQTGLEGARELARRLPDARLEVYDRSGHFMYLDEPERFAQDVTAFLTPTPAEHSSH